MGVLFCSAEAQERGIVTWMPRADMSGEKQNSLYYTNTSYSLLSTRADITNN